MTDYKLDNHFNDSFKQVALGVSIGERNQLAEFSKILRSGSQMVELDLASLYGFTGEGTPAARITKTERQAIGNLARSNDADLSVHAPWSINFSGINPRSGERDKEYQNLMKNEVQSAIKFTDDISRPMGREHMPIIFHASSDNFGAPDPSLRISAYDRENDKVMSMGPQKIPNMTIGEFKKTYGDDTFKRLQNNISEKNGSVILSPQGAFEFQKDQLRINYNQELSSLDISEYNIKIQKEDLARRLADARIRGSPEEKELIGRKDNLDQMEMDLGRKRFMLKKEIENIDKRFVPFSEEAPRLAAEGIKDAALIAAKTPSRPMILAENPMTPDMSLSNPSELKKTIEDARGMFVDAAMKDKSLGLTRRAAEELSRQLIGVNLDVGHLNTFKSITNPETGKAYSNEDVVRMAKEVKDYIKRYHLNDNMGDIDAHMPLGEGTAPVKEIYETLKNAGVEAPAIMEVFGGQGGITAGMGPSLQYMGQPLFGETPYVGLPSYASNPYSSIVGDYSSYLNLGLRNDLFQYGGFSGISPALGAGYAQNTRGGGDFSGAPMV